MAPHPYRATEKSKNISAFWRIDTRILIGTIGVPFVLIALLFSSPRTAQAVVGCSTGPVSTISWGAGCSGFNDCGFLDLGQSCSVGNSAPGYNGSYNFSCDTRGQLGVSSSCAPSGIYCSPRDNTCPDSAPNTCGQTSPGQCVQQGNFYVCYTPSAPPDSSCPSPAINGSCAAAHYGCTAGSSINNASNASSWTWSCAGSNGGSTASCSEAMASCSASGVNSWGAGCSAYVNTTVPSGSSVTNTNTAPGYSGSITWTCSNGAWTGPSGVSCTANPVSCTLPWGGSVSSGSSVTAYQTSSVVSPTSCGSVAETRTCTNGSLSGSYANQSCSVVVPTYTISASAGAGGSISPSGAVSVSQGNSQTFFITPNGGYTVSSVIVDNANQGATGSYTFNNVQGNHTISANFASANVAPTAPTISGPTSGNANTLYTFTVTATDPENEQIRYGLDWKEPANGVADLWLPAGVGYVNSGTAQSATHSWATPGTHTFRALAQDAPGLNSGWSSYSFTVASCTPSYSCVGNNLYYTDATCTQTLSQTCSYRCAGSACIAPPAISFVPFAATNATFGPFTASGHLQMKPQLLWSGDRTTLYWNVSNAQSCTVTGGNGDSWSGLFSGSSGKTSSPIVSQTTYTLLCTALPGSTPVSVSETATVNIIPVFQEK